MSMVRLAEKLAAATASCDAGDRIRVPLTALSVACLCVDLPGGHGEALRMLIPRRDTHLYASLLLRSGTNTPMVDALDSWVEKASKETVQALRDCFEVLADVDLVKLSEADDILGYVYGELRSKFDRSGSGAFYTPLDVARLIALLNLGDDVKPGQSIYDPTCGSGTMFIGLADAIRARGLDPLDFVWRGQDLDGIACALAMVNLTYRSISRVPRPRDVSWFALDHVAQDIAAGKKPALSDGF